MTDVPFLLPFSALQARDAWPEIKDRITALAGDHGEAWMAEDVFHQIQVGNAHLWALDDLSGFVVLQVFVSSYERVLHVWICCNNSSNRMIDYFDQIKGIAAENDCKRVTFESSRRYERALPDLKVRYLYSAEIGG
jgi:hypothetical protein